jgi:DNA-binding MarR family transcriptional regulator
VTAHLEAWTALQALVTDRLDDYRREVAAVSGLPFSRARALRRLVPGPITHGALAEALMTDRPAATVTVDDLCARGLAVRTPHPTDRRRKLVSLTDEGRRIAALVEAVIPPPPPGWADVAPADLEALGRVVRTVRT